MQTTNPAAAGFALRRATRGLDGFRAGPVRDGYRDHGTLVRDGPAPQRKSPWGIPPGLPSACGRRQTRRAEAGSRCDANHG
jgi:hypothetical protein